MARTRLRERAHALLYTLGGLAVPGGVPFGLIDREPAAADPRDDRIKARPADAPTRHRPATAP